MSRTLNVVRMQLVNRQTYLWVPAVVLLGALIITLAIYLILARAGLTGPFYGAGAQAPLWYYSVVGVQALTLTFPFSQAMSVTRREFYLGTLLTAGLSAAVLAVVFVIGGLIEQATGGWGINGYFFYIPGLWAVGPLGAGLAFFAATLVIFTACFWAATIYKRFGAIVLTVVLVAFGLLLVAGLFVIAMLDAWGPVFGWLGDQGVVGLSLWGLLITAVMAALSYLTLRRAVP